MRIPQSDSGVAVVTRRRFATWKMEDGVVRLLITDSELDGPDARELLAALDEVCSGAKAPVLADITRLRQISRDVRTTMSSGRAAQLIEVAAVIVSNPINRMLGQFFIRLNKPQFALKLFDDPELALQWARQHGDDPAE